MMLATMPFIDRIGFEKGEVIGYTTMVVAFLLIFFGIRSYRDNVAGGSVGFGRAFAVGALIALVASVFYVATWQVVYYKLVPDFGEKYQAHLIEEARAEGESQAAIDEKIADAREIRAVVSQSGNQRGGHVHRAVAAWINRCPHFGRDPATPHAGLRGRINRLRAEDESSRPPLGDRLVSSRGGTRTRDPGIMSAVL